MLGIAAFYNGEYDQAREHFEESLALLDAGEGTWLSATDLCYLGFISYAQEDYAQARRLSEESLTLARLLGVPFNTSEVMTILACELMTLEEETRAQALLEEALALAREKEHAGDVARVLWGVGHLALRQGKLTEAQVWFEESVAKVQGRWLVPRLKWVVASNLEGLGEIALAQGQASRAVQLVAAAQVVREVNGYYTPFGIERPFYDRTLAAARAQLGEKDFAALWAEGQKLTPQQALAAAARTPILTLGPVAPDAVSSSTPPPALPGGLTAREVKVLRLMAIGLSKKQIAEQLVLSPNTVNVHIQSIYGKLGINSRSAATRYAIEHHLA